MQVDIAAWKKSQTSAEALSKFRKSADGQKLYSKLDIIQDTIDSRLKKGEALTIEQSRKLIEDIVYKEMREEAERQEAEAKRKAEEAKRMTLNKYIHTYRDDVVSGKRMNAHGKAFSISSIKTIKTCIVQFDSFQDFVGKKYNFDDIDLNFRNEFLAYLYTEKKYSTNTAAKCIENLATILGSAVAEGHTDFIRIVIAGRSEDFCVPCGICRQVMQEFAPELEVICLNGAGEEKSFMLKELLPYGFDNRWLPQ